MERRFQIVAGGASILSLAIVAMPLLYHGNNASYYQAVVAAFVLVLLAFLFYWMKRYDVNLRSEVKKEDLLRAARQHIESATKKVILFSNDLSWATDYADAIRNRIDSNCIVIVVHKKNENEKVKQNAEMLKSWGAHLIELEEDHFFRATLIDPDDPSIAKLFVARKKRKPGSAVPLPSGHSGTDRDFNYECAVYQNGADKILIKSLVYIANKIIPGEVG